MIQIKDHKSPHDIVNIILVEDNKYDAILINELLVDSLPQVCNVTHCKNLALALEYISKENFDLVLLDLFLPDSAGFDTFKSIKNSDADLPIIILSGQDDEKLSIDVVKEGAQEYLLKGEVGSALLRRAIFDAIERKKIEIELAYSERRFRSMIEYGNDIISILNQDGMIVYKSPSANRILGYETKEIIGTKFEKFVHPEDRKNFIQYFNKVLIDPHSTLTIEYRFRHKNGSLIYVETVCINLLNDPAVRGVVLNSRNISKRRETDEQIRKLSSAVEQSSASVIITDTEGEIEYANQKFSEISGYAIEDVIGKNPRILKSGKQSVEFYKKLWGAIKSGKEWHGEFNNRKKNGDLYWEMASISPIKNSLNEITHFVAVKEDVTEQKKAQDEILLLAKEIQKAKERADEANRLKSTFLANMSHEIRTPMNAILGYTDLLLDEEEDSDKKEKLNTISASGKYLLNLINDILDFSKIEANKLGISKKEFSLINLFKYLEKMFIIKASKKNITFKIDIDKTLPAVVLGDEFRINQVIINILSNAFKFTKRGGISISCKRVDHSLVQIKVNDTGIGIPKNKLDLIFSPFRQVESSFSRSFSGTGLGLTISRKLMELMGGTISVESKYGIGSAFIIKVPLPEVEKRADKNIYKFKGYNIDEELTENLYYSGNGPIDLKKYISICLRELPNKIDALGKAVLSNTKEEILQLTSEIAKCSAYTTIEEVRKKAATIEKEIKRENYNIDQIKFSYNELQKVIATIPEKHIKKEITERELSDILKTIKVLIAEDNIINQRLAEAMLSKMNVSVSVADNGEIALEMLKKENFDLLLLDMHMPVMDGMETLKHIKSNEEITGIEIVALTADAMKGDSEKYINAGCDDYMSKPISRDVLYDKVCHAALNKLMCSCGKIDKKMAFNAIPLFPANERVTRKIVLDEQEKNRVNEIIIDLKENLVLFDKDKILSLADKIGVLSDSDYLKEIEKELSGAALSFDDQALGPVITKLENLARK